MCVSTDTDPESVGDLFMLTDIGGSYCPVCVCVPTDTGGFYCPVCVCMCVHTGEYYCRVSLGVH